MGYLPVASPHLRLCPGLPRRASPRSTEDLLFNETPDAHFHLHVGGWTVAEISRSSVRLLYVGNGLRAARDGLWICL